MWYVPSTSPLPPRHHPSPCLSLPLPISLPPPTPLFHRLICDSEFMMTIIEKGDETEYEWRHILPNNFFLKYYPMHDKLTLFTAKERYAPPYPFLSPTLSHSSSSCPPLPNPFTNPDMEYKRESTSSKQSRRARGSASRWRSSEWRSRASCYLLESFSLICTLIQTPMVTCMFSSLFLLLLDPPVSLLCRFIPLFLFFSISWSLPRLPFLLFPFSLALPPPHPLPHLPPLLSPLPPCPSPSPLSFLIHFFNQSFDDYF